MRQVYLLFATILNIQLFDWSDQMFDKKFQEIIFDKCQKAGFRFRKLPLPLSRQLCSQWKRTTKR